MKKAEVDRYDAFTTVAGKGNPAGVVLNAQDYSTAQMQEIARQIGFSECVFLLPSERADFRLRYFTPGAEVNLCGHATVASIYAMFKDTPPEADPIRKKAETKAGVIDVVYDPKSREVLMSQADAQFIEFTGDKAALAEAIGLSEEDLDPAYPIVYGSTGLWTVIIPIEKLEAFSRMVPDNTRFSKLFSQQPNASVHPVCTETLKQETDMHGRHFSPASTGRIEDPVTGTACGVMGAYYISYMHPDRECCDLLIEQGQEAGYDGVVHVWARKENGAVKVKIAGTAVKVETLIAQL